MENYLAKQINGFDTRNNFIRSMDIAKSEDLNTALDNYCKAWFSSRRKHYISEAFKHLSDKTKPLFWSSKAIYDMIDEIAISLMSDLQNNGYDRKKLSADIDKLKSKLTIWSTKRRNQPFTRDDITHEIRSFEAKYNYPCPDTFKTCWMNTGAYITLNYEIKYDNLILPGCENQAQSLALLSKLRLEIISDMEHDVDTRLFEVCYRIFKNKAIKI